MISFKIEAPFLRIAVASLFLFSADGWSSSFSDDESEDDLEQPRQVQVAQTFESQIKQEAQESDYQQRSFQRRWCARGATVYGLAGEIMKISSSGLDLLAVVTAALAASDCFQDSQYVRYFALVAALSETTSIALDRLGSRSKKASRKYSKKLADLNQADIAGRFSDLEETSPEMEEEEEEDSGLGEV